MLLLFLYVLPFFFSLPSLNPFPSFLLSPYYFLFIVSLVPPSPLPPSLLSSYHFRVILHVLVLHFLMYQCFLIIFLLSFCFSSFLVVCLFLFLSLTLASTHVSQLFCSFSLLASLSFSCISLTPQRWFRFNTPNALTHPSASSFFVIVLLSCFSCCPPPLHAPSTSPTLLLKKLRTCG